MAYSTAPTWLPISRTCIRRTPTGRSSIDLYSQVDTESPRFLGFEKWWGNPVCSMREEMQWIADELFVGNKLSSGELRTSDGIRVDLRNIKSPIIVFCSKGDDITPPQQALDWILDLYDHENELIANGQTIVYTLHESIGHLGIFVSGKVASKEDKELIQFMDMIDLLPPGLYEAVITEVDDNVENQELDQRPLPVQPEGAHAGRYPGIGRQRCRGRIAFRNRAMPSPRSTWALSHVRQPDREEPRHRAERKSHCVSCIPIACVSRFSRTKTRSWPPVGWLGKYRPH